MDVRSLEFEDGDFHVAIDKGVSSCQRLDISGISVTRQERWMLCSQ